MRVLRIVGRGFGKEVMAWDEVMLEHLLFSALVIPCVPSLFDKSVAKQLLRSLGANRDNCLRAQSASTHLQRKICNGYILERKSH